MLLSSRAQPPDPATCMVVLVVDHLAESDLQPAWAEMRFFRREIFGISRVAYCVFAKSTRRGRPVPAVDIAECGAANADRVLRAWTRRPA